MNLLINLHTFWCSVKISLYMSLLSEKKLQHYFFVDGFVVLIFYLACLLYDFHYYVEYTCEHRHSVAFCILERNSIAFPYSVWCELFSCSIWGLLFQSMFLLYLIYYHEGGSVLSYAFSAVIDTIITCLCFLLLTWCVIVTDLSVLNRLCTLGIDLFHARWLFTMLDSICWYLNQDFCICVHQRHWFVASCCSVLVCFGYQGSAGLTQWVWKYSLHLFFSYIF